MRQSEAHGEYEDEQLQLEKFLKIKIYEIFVIFIIVYQGRDPI